MRRKKTPRQYYKKLSYSNRIRLGLFAIHTTNKVNKALSSHSLPNALPVRIPPSMCKRQPSRHTLKWQVASGECEKQ